MWDKQENVDVGEIISSAGLYDRHMGFGFKSGKVFFNIQKSLCSFTPMGSLIILNCSSLFCS